MGVLRCSAKYRKLFGLPERLEEPAAPVCGLGAWYDYLPDGASLWDAMLRLARAPAGPLDYDSPDRVAPRLVEDTWRGPRLVS